MQTGNFSFEILNLTFEGKNVKYFLKVIFFIYQSNVIHFLIKLILYANNGNLYKETIREKR
jgi:hypothetical protein